MPPPMDWLSRLLEMTPVRGRLDLRCYYGAPWRIDQASAEPGEIPFHVVLAGSAVLEDPAGGPPQHLAPGDILLIAQGGAHTLHDGSGAKPVPARARAGLNVTFSENAGSGERLDMLCGHFVLAEARFRGAGMLMTTYEVSIEIENEKKPALTARWITIIQFDPKDRPEDA